MAWSYLTSQPYPQFQGYLTPILGVPTPNFRITNPQFQGYLWDPNIQHWNKDSSRYAMNKILSNNTSGQGLYRDVLSSSDKELKFRMRVKQSQILTVQYVNSRQHTGKWRFSYIAVMACLAVWSSRKLVQWNVIVLYPFCVWATLHVPVKSLLYIPKPFRHMHMCLVIL